MITQLSLPEVETAALRELFMNEARWLAEFLAKRKKEGTMPEMLDQGIWEGEPEFNSRIATLREMQHSFWERSGKGDAAAATIARGTPLLPYSGMRPEGLLALFAGIAHIPSQKTEMEELKEAA